MMAVKVQQDAQLQASCPQLPFLVAPTASAVIADHYMWYSMTLPMPFHLCYSGSSSRQCCQQPLGQQAAAATARRTCCSSSC